MGTPISASDRISALEERVGLDTSEENKIGSGQLKKALAKILADNETFNAARQKLFEQANKVRDDAVAYITKAPLTLADTLKGIVTFT